MPLDVDAAVIGNTRLSDDYSVLALAAPAVAALAKPGQFVMLRLSGVNDPLIGRALALYDTVLSESGDPHGIELVYFVKGK